VRRTLLITGATVVLLGGAVAGSALAWGSDGKVPAATAGLPPATAEVTRTTLVETTTVAGRLGYGDPVPVSAAERGTLTWIAPVGSTVKRGEPLFKVDQRPVVALYGPLPMYRTLQDGTKGADVKQLERNLADLGYRGLTVDDTYTPATAAAVDAWQADLGLPVTGTVEPGQVVVTRRAVRIAAHTARAGDTIGADTGGVGAPVLSYTGTTRRVAVELEVADWALAVTGRPVTVTIPGRGTVTGKITRVGTVVTAQAITPDGTTPGGGTSPDVGASPAPSTATLEVTVRIADQKALGPLDAAPVDVDFVSDKREGVLAVPVAALLALPQGGFGVQVVDRGTTRIVAVKTGMFAAGQVEVSGKGIAEGVTVGVPK
jgi:peptidoglycan hydrolase-like protein with peptidoglycan-binding domain